MFTLLKIVMLFFFHIYEHAVIIDVKLTKAKRVFEKCIGNHGNINSHRARTVGGLLL